MFMDAIKIAAKIAALTAGVAFLVGLVGQIVFPAFDFGWVAEAVGHGRAIVNYYCGPFASLFQFALILITFRFATIPLARITILAYRWILKVNN